MKIVCENVSKSYGGHQVLGDISFTVGDGQFFAMIGANGTGKTTLLDIITKRIEATSGNITIGVWCFSVFIFQLLYMTKF